MDRSGRGKVLEKYETGCKYEEMAEALKGRSEAAIRNKLSKLRAEGEKREDLYIGGRGSAHREVALLFFEFWRKNKLDKRSVYMRVKPKAETG